MVEINEHDFVCPSKSLEVVVLLLKSAEVRKFGRLWQHEHNIYFFPDTPLGVHTSVHDADKNHPTASIHMKIPDGKGIFQAFPGGAEVENPVVLKRIPPFNQINDVIPIYPGQCYLSVDALWQQSPECAVTKIGKRQKICVDLGSFAGAFVGFQIFLVGKDNISGISEWCTREEIGRSAMGSMRVKSVDLFKVFVPWVGIVVEDYQSYI